MRKQTKKLESKYKKKVGLPPGTIVYTGDKELHDEIIIEHLSYNNDYYEYKILKSLEHFLEKEDGVNWFNIDGIHNVDLIKKIGETKKIDSFILEDIANINLRPKIEERKNSFFITLKMMKIEEDKEKNTEKKIDVEQLSVIIGEGYVLTFQEKRGDVFKIVRERIKNNIGKIREKGSDYLSYELIDILVDNYFLVIEHIEEELDNFEEKLLITTEKGDLEKIIKIKKEFFKIKRNISLVNDIVGKLNNTGSLKIFKEDMKYYLQDLHDHTARLNDHLENITSRVHSLVEIYHSTQNKQLNDVMKIFTIITTIFVPLSFITGVYGMNFENMPYLQDKDSFKIVMGTMFVIAIGMLGIFKKKKWI